MDNSEEEKSQIDWVTLLVIIGRGKKKRPALRITAGDTKGGQRITFTFCLYDRPQLQTILHIPASFSREYLFMLNQAIQLIDELRGELLTKSALEEAAQRHQVEFISSDIPAEPHRFQKTRPKDNSKHYPFKEALNRYKRDE